MAKCEHDIGCEFNYGFSNLISEEELYKTIFEKINSDCEKGKLNFRRKNYIPKDTMDYMFYFFDYCPWCGEKLDEREIQKRLNQRSQEYVKKIEAANEDKDLLLKAMATTNKIQKAVLCGVAGLKSKKTVKKICKTCVYRLIRPLFKKEQLEKIFFSSDYNMLSGVQKQSFIYIRCLSYDNILYF